MVTPYGRDNAFLMLGVALSLLLLALTPVHIALRVAFGALGIVLTFFTLWFFRDSERPLTSEAINNPHTIVAPADGQVTEVTRIERHADFSGPVIQITIFLSPLNLHVNRYPASGTITAVRYFEGKYLMAFNPKASEENERSEFVMMTPGGQILFRQITGFLARRVVYDVCEGAVVSAGARFGMMKFGSRMDVLVPASAEICVSVGQNVVSARDVLARLSKEQVV